MKCPKCEFENRPGARFCKQCGQTLQDAAPKPAPPAGITCPACSAANDADARFCRRCGKPLSTEPALPAAPRPRPPEDVRVHIEGDVSGQVAIGNNILQIGDVHGGVVNVMMPGQKVQPRPRPTPVSLRPRPFPDLLDRETELQAATTALQAAKPVEFHGRPGLGKTTLLRHLAHHPTAAAFPDGVVYLSARRQPLEDLLQSLYDAFYETNVPYKPTDAQLKHDLLNKRALVLLDDVGLAREEVETALNTVPACAFLLGSPERRLWGEGQSIPLGGLPPDDALALIERELGRSLTPEERPAARLLHDATQGHPLRLIQAAAEAREGGQTLVKAIEREDVIAPSPLAALDALPAPERQVLAALAALGGAPVHADHLTALARLPDVAPALQALSRRGLVQAHSPRYSPTGGLAQALQQAWDLTPWMERAVAHFRAWVEGQQQDPEHLLEEAEAILWVLEWAVKAGRWADVLRMGRAVEGALTMGRRWAAWEQVLRWSLQAGRALKDRAAEAWALHQLGTRALCLGDASTARTALGKALRLREALGDQAGAAITRHNLSLVPGAPPAPPKGKPPAPKARRPLPKWLLPAAGIVVAGGVVAAVGAAIIISQVIPPPPPPPSTEMMTPTPTVTPTPTPTPTVTPTPAPWVTVELEGGCDREYNDGDQTLIRVESNTGGPVKVWLDGRRSIGGFELPPGRVWEREWVFDDTSPGEHEFTATLMDSGGGILAEASCPFTLLPPCIDFEDLQVDDVYEGESTFRDSGASISVLEGNVIIEDGRKAGGSGNELHVDSATVTFGFGTSLSGLSFRYNQSLSETTPNVTLQINGKSETAALMESFDGRTIGSVDVSVSNGTVRLDGTINQIIISGLNLYIDDVCPSY